MSLDDELKQRKLERQKSADIEKEAKTKWLTAVKGILQQTLEFLKDTLDEGLLKAEGPTRSPLVMPSLKLIELGGKTIVFKPSDNHPSIVTIEVQSDPRQAYGLSWDGASSWSIVPQIVIAHGGDPVQGRFDLQRGQVFNSENLKKVLSDLLR